MILFTKFEVVDFPLNATLDDGQVVKGKAKENATPVYLKGRGSLKSNSMQTFLSWTQSEILQCTIVQCNKEHDKDNYTAYQIYTKVKKQDEQEVEFVVNRRFSQFYWLSKRLFSQYPTRIVPSLPGKSAKASTSCNLDFLDRFEPRFVEKRKISLQRFLDFVVQDKELVSSESLLLFLTHETLPMELYKVESHANIVNRVFSLAFGEQICVSEEIFLSLLKKSTKWQELLGKIHESSEGQVNSFAKYARKSLSTGLFFEELEHELALPLAECMKNSTKAAESLEQSIQTGLFLLVQDVKGFMINAKVRKCISFHRNSFIILECITGKRNDSRKVSRKPTETKAAYF